MCVVVGVAEAIFVMWFRYCPFLWLTKKLTETFIETPYVIQTACVLFWKSAIRKKTKTWCQEKRDSRGFQIFWRVKPLILAYYRGFNEIPGTESVSLSFNSFLMAVHAKKGKKHSPVIVSWLRNPNSLAFHACGSGRSRVRPYASSLPLANPSKEALSQVKFYVHIG